MILRETKKTAPVFDLLVFTGAKELSSIAPLKTLMDYDYLRITKEKNIPHPAPTVTIDGAAIAAPGNITGISAQIKAGKTAINGAIIAAAISEKGEADGFMSINCEPAKGKAIIIMDTEQCEADHQDNVNAILRRAGLDRTPDNLRSYNIRQLGMKDYRRVTNDICELCAEQFGGLHLITIDGGADYIASVNDEEQASQIFEYFTHLAIKFDCPVIIIVHLNPNSDKERGHFGSTLQRKCYGLLTVEKEKGKDISKLIPKAFRKAGNDDVSPIHFAYDKEKHYHVQVAAPDVEKEKTSAVLAKHWKIATDVFTGKTLLSYTDLYKAIMHNTGKLDRTSKEIVKTMIGLDFITQLENKKYKLNNVLVQ